MLLWHAERTSRKKKLQPSIDQPRPIENLWADIKNKILERANEIIKTDYDD
jgi:hypothetical protein